VEKDSYRLEAFSDGVFSIAITLLALDLRVPVFETVNSKNLFEALLKEWPSYLAFTASFMSILVMWINHHGIFKSVRKTSSELFFANGFLLMLTVVTPFTTALVARYLRTPAASAAMAVYAGSFIIISIAYNWLWAAATGCSHATEHLNRVTRHYRLGLPIYCLATAVAFLNPLLSLGICIGLWIFWAVTMREA